MTLQENYLINSFQIRLKFELIFDYILLLLNIHIKVILSKIYVIGIVQWEEHAILILLKKILITARSRFDSVYQ